MRPPVALLALVLALVLALILDGAGLGCRRGAVAPPGAAPAPREAAAGQAATETPSGPPPAAATPRVKVMEIPPGAGSWREAISPGEVHAYRLALPAGEAARLTVEQEGADVSLRVVDPAGGERILMDRPTGDRGVEWVSLLAESAGAFRLEVGMPPGTAAAGHYRATLDGPRPAEPRDRDEIEAERAFVSARRWEREAQGAAESAQTSDERRAVEEYAKAFAAWSRAGEARGQAAAGFGLAEARAELGDWNGAFDLHQSLFPLYRSAGELQLLAAAYNTCGVALRQRGQFRRAVESYRQAQKLGEASGSTQAQITASENIATAELVQQRTREALDQLVPLAAMVRRQGRDPARLGNLLYKIGQAYLDLGDADGADSYFAEVRTRSRQRGRQMGEALALEGMARADLLRERGERARRQLEESLALMPAKGRDLDRATALNTLGRADRQLGLWKEALDAYGEALELLRAQGAGRDAAIVEMNRAWVLDETGETALALSQYREVLAYFRGHDDPSGVASALYGMALALSHQGALAEAQAAIERALGLVERRREELLSTELGELYGASKQRYFSFYADLLMQRHAREPTKGFDALALAAADRGRAWGLSTALREARAGLLSTIDPNLGARREEVWEEISSRKWSRGDSPGAVRSEVEPELRDLLTRLDLLEAEAQAKSPRLGALVQPRAPDLREIQDRLLDADTRVVLFSLGEKRSLAFVVGRDRFTVHPLAPREPIERAAREAYERLVGSGRRTGRVGAEEALAALSRLLLAPLGDDLDAPRLVIVPDGALSYIPFAALPDPLPAAPGEPLVARHEVVHIPSLAVLAELRRMQQGRPPPPGDVAVFADPVFGLDDPRGAAAAAPRQTADGGEAAPEGELQPLRYSRVEADAILAQVPEERRFAALGFDANLDALWHAPLARYRVLHLATHALIDESEPSLSYLVLSRLDREGRWREGRLYLHDIYRLDLPIDLVVLSACETARGKELRGEGLVGMTQAFMYAGAPRAVVSLWPVDDQATSELMRRFYHALFSLGLTPAAALRQAEDSLRREPPWRAPYDWAGFILEGDWH